MYPQRSLLQYHTCTCTCTSGRAVPLPTLGDAFIYLGSTARLTPRHYYFISLSVNQSNPSVLHASNATMTTRRDTKRIRDWFRCSGGDLPAENVEGKEQITSYSLHVYF